MQVWKDTSDVSGVCADPDAADAVIPSQTELLKRVASYKKSLQLTAQQIRELGIIRYSARRYPLTASTFGRIL